MLDTFGLESVLVWCFAGNVVRLNHETCKVATSRGMLTRCSCHAPWTRQSRGAETSACEPINWLCGTYGTWPARVDPVACGVFTCSSCLVHSCTRSTTVTEQWARFVRCAISRGLSSRLHSGGCAALLAVGGLPRQCGSSEGHVLPLLLPQNVVMTCAAMTLTDFMDLASVHLQVEVAVPPISALNRTGTVDGCHLACALLYVIFYVDIMMIVICGSLPFYLQSSWKCGNQHGTVGARTI